MGAGEPGATGAAVESRAAARERRERVVILGAAGRDFHDFNLLYRDDPATEVVAFTASQIPGIEGRRYPPALAGPLYPDGIPIEDEARLEAICRAHRVDRVVFAYSDLSHEQVMHLASRALATGASFELPGPARTQLAAERPVIAISAVRTGVGKSQTARWLVDEIRARGLRAAAVRHPMPYGDLAAQRAQRFAHRRDLDEARCTAEEREEYEPYLERGAVVFAGVDYGAILARAQEEADILVWDGGNNDLPFFRPDLHIVLVDALRPDQVASHHPGEAALRSADVVVIAKTDAAGADATQRAVDAVRRLRPEVPLVRAGSPVELERADAVAGKRVVVVDDGPTLTHGGMAYGAGQVAATAAGAEIVDPRPWAVGALAEAFEHHPHLERVLPALGYGREQLADLERTLQRVPADFVVSGTPLDLAKLVAIETPILRARYEYRDGTPGLREHVARFLDKRVPKRGLATADGSASR